MAIATAMGITTARATGSVTLFPSVGFWQPGLELLEPLQASRLMNAESPERGLSTSFLMEAGSGNARAVGSLLRRWRSRWLRCDCRGMIESN